MRIRLVRGVIAGTVFALAFSFVPFAVFAEDSEIVEDAQLIAAPAEGDRGQKLKERLQELRQKRQQNRQQRLAENRLRVCEQRKVRINAIMDRAILRAEKHLDLFSSISDRVQNFYLDKGYTLDNYEELVTAVDTAKAQAQANLETLKDLDSFECTADDPKGNIEEFKLALKTINQDLKDFRTAVKNLIVGVKSAKSTQATEAGNGSE